MIRRAQTKDTNRLYQLENTLFSKDDFGLSRASIYYHMKKSDIFIYEEDSELLGYILWLKRKNYYRLYSLAVKKEFQGKRIATKLLEHSLSKLIAYKYQLEVKIDNPHGIALYEKYGFVKQKVLKGFYPKAQDGYLMVRKKDV